MHKYNFKCMVFVKCMTDKKLILKKVIPEEIYLLSVVWCSFLHYESRMLGEGPNF